MSAATVCNGKYDDYFVEGPPEPSFTWKPGFELEGEPFDAKKHLQIELPASVKDQKFCDVQYPYTGVEKNVKCGLSYTRPFRVLSDEGVKAARASIERNKQRLQLKDCRTACFLRGLGHVSNFHRGLAYSPELLEVLSSLARDPVCPQTTPMNISHTNIGEVGTGRPVDRWHTDSTDYVLVLILSDIADMEGGDLRVLQMPDARATVSCAEGQATESLFAKMQREGVPESLVETVRYSGAGYGIFMQGSKILHCVSEVLKAREPRISLVNSYMTRRVFAQPDQTRYCLYLQNDGKDVASVDYARHKAWRVGGQLKLIADHAAYSTSLFAGTAKTFPNLPEPQDDASTNDVSTDGESSMPPRPPADAAKMLVRPTTEELSEILRNAAAELAHAADLLDGRADDHSKWVN